MTSEKIYALSDLHVDQKENMQWIEQLSDVDYLNDTIIIAGSFIGEKNQLKISLPIGDITHVLSKLFQTLKLFQSKFHDVYYCPGNHELWTKSQKEDEQLNIHNSIDKFHYVKYVLIIEGFLCFFDLDHQNL